MDLQQCPLKPQSCRYLKVSARGSGHRESACEGFPPRPDIAQPSRGDRELLLLLLLLLCQGLLLLFARKIYGPDWLRQQRLRSARSATAMATLCRRCLNSGSGSSRALTAPDSMSSTVVWSDVMTWYAFNRRENDLQH